MSLPFNPEEGLIVVPVHLWGPERDVIVHSALDTGATGSLVNWDTVVLMGYDPAIAKERVRITTGSGVEFAPRIVVQKIEALGKERFNFPVICHTLPPSAIVDGVLGLDFFRETRLIVDFRKGLVIIE
ncbi:MAG: retropepsin-like aspartic protease [Anaerolineae bacterium]